MYCTTCQADRQEGSKFCFECGTKVLKRCGNRKDDGTLCGEVLIDGAKFCPECGCPQSSVTRAPLSGPAEQTTIRPNESVILESKQTTNDAQSKDERCSSESGQAEQTTIRPNENTILESKQKTNDEQSKDERCSSESDSEYVSAEEDADASPSRHAEHDYVAKKQLAQELKEVTVPERTLKQEHEPISEPIAEPEDIEEAETEKYQELDHQVKKVGSESDPEAQPKKTLEVEPAVTGLSQKQILKEDMITEEDENFLRASILLLKGGRLISKETFYKELRKAGVNLDVLLKKYEKKFKHTFVKKQREKLFPDSGVIDVETWDLAMLTTVSLKVFKESLSDDEKNNLKSIKCMRDEIYAHTYSSSLSADQYEKIQNELQNALTSLSNGLSEKLKDDCFKIIQECTTGPISPSLKEELTKLIEDTEHTFQAVMNKLRNQNEFLCEMKKDIMKELNKISVSEDRSEKIIKVIDTELTLSGAVNESRDVDFAEEIITTVINKAIKKVGNENDYPRIRSVVDKILKDIENMPDVEILPALHKCILLKFKCTSYIGILNMLMYLESRSFLESLNDLALALSSTLPNVSNQFRLNATVTPECMKDLLDELRAKTMETTKYERTIRVPIKVESVQGIKHIWSLFENGGASNKLNELSEAVFDELNTKITVTPSVNLEQVQAAIKEAEVSQAAVEDNASSPQRHQSKSVDAAKGQYVPEQYTCDNVTLEESPKVQSENAAEKTKTQTTHFEPNDQGHNSRMTAFADSFAMETSPAENKWHLETNKHALTQRPKMKNIIRTYFHALLPKDFKFNHETDKVELRIVVRDRNGKWQEFESRLMDVIKVHTDVDNAVEIKGDADIEVPQVFEKKIGYTYLVRRKSLNKKDAQRKDVIGLLRNKSDEKIELSIEKSAENIGYWHQYDGILYKKKKKGFLSASFEYIWTISNEKRETYEIIMRVFGNQIAHTWSRETAPSEIADLMINMSFQLAFCTERLYTDSKIKQKINVHLWNAFQDLFDSLELGQGQDIMRKTCLLIVMLYIRQLPGLETSVNVSRYLSKKFLVHIDVDTKVAKEFAILTQYFPKKERNIIRQKLVEFTDDIARNQDPSWWYLMPAIHFLSDLCKPFDPISRDADHSAKEPKWWGLNFPELDKAKNTYKCGKEVVKISVETVIQELSQAGYFQADYYLPRTIVASLNLHEITHILQREHHGLPLEILFAAIRYYIKERPDDDNVSLCLHSLMVQTEQELGSSDISGLLLKVKISADMSVTALECSGKQQVIERCIGIYLCCQSRYVNAVTKCNKSGEETWDFEWTLTISALVIKWMGRQPSPDSSTFENYLARWNGLFYTQQPTHVDEKWNRSLIGALLDKIKESLKRGDLEGQDILTIYCNRHEQFGKPMKTMMTELVYEVIGDPKSVISTSLNDHDRSQLREIMFEKFNSQWKSISGNSMAMDLQAILHWESLPLFLAVLWNEENILEMANLNRVMRLLDNYADILMSGAITIKDMGVLTKNSKQFLHLLQFSKVQDRVVHIEAALSTRSQEYQILDQTLRDLQLLEIFCSNLEIVDLLKLKELLKLNVEKSRLCDVISISSEFKSKDVRIGEVKLKAFAVTTDITNVITCLHQFWESLYFKKLWNEETRKYTNSKVLTLAEVYKTAVVPVVERLKEMTRDISTGSITFDDLERSIGHLFQDNYDNLFTELTVICTDSTDTETDHVICKIQKYRKMVFLKGVAETILNIRDTYHLEGDFRVIEQIQRLDVQQYKLSDSIEDELEVFIDLEDITPERHNCLKAFSVCSDVVTWLRETLEEPKLKELKVFVDLAMMSAGDNIEQSDRVQSLHSAVTGYASLIFDLDSNGGYDHFLQMCDYLWKELDNMENLNMKLVHANQHLYWFKDIKKTHGAVEVTSFMQAETVNENGVYMIGSGARQDNEDVPAHIQIDSDDYKEQVLSLLIPASSDGKRVAKHYRYSELKDLQSRLLLVGGESEQVKHCIDRFSTIFDGVIRLCNIYIKLVTSGCVLFKDFEIQVYCNPSTERPVCVVIEFKNGDDLTQLKCHKTEEELIEGIMPKVAGSMETCLSEWLQFVRNRRNEHEHLNYFTTDQLVILQREIAKVMLDENPSVKVFPILQLMRKQCTSDDIKKANLKAKEEIQRQDTKPEAADETLPKKDKDVSKRNYFIQQLKNARLTDMIPFALEVFKNSYDVPKAIRWCMKKRVELPQMKAARRGKQIQEGMKETEDDTYQEIFHDSNIVLCDVMLKKLQSIWHNFIQAASSNRYISLKHLGCFLQQLKSEDTDALQRLFPANFEETSPNLIICPPHEIVHATISLYMTDEKQPLPRTEEVLICSPDTKLEEIDVFLQRAIFSSQNKIHCVLNADLLSHTMCESVEQRLTQYLRNKGKSARFRLVFICSSENQHKSPIVSSLDGYRKEPIFQDIKRVSTYIAERLKVFEEHAAASVDNKSSTVRVVSSTRSGVGKTLYKKRKVEILQNNRKTTDPLSITLSLHGRYIDVDNLVEKLLPHTRHPEHHSPMIIHINVANEEYTKRDLEVMLFNLLVLGNLVHSSGYVWKKDPLDLYLIERPENPKSSPEEICQIFRFLPKVICHSPKECVDCLSGKQTKAFDVDDQLFDQKLFESELYQKPYNYLSQLDRGVSNMNTSTKTAVTSKEQCLKTLLSHCRIDDPSWSELHHFVQFLNTQLNEFENNLFVSNAFRNELPGFSTFVLKFLIQMSKDFSSRSLNMSEETETTTDDENQLKSFQMKRKWESSPHPYIFFNADGISFTFLGFYIDPITFDLIDQQTGKTLEENIMEKDLYGALKHNKVPITENFDTLNRKDKIERLCRVMDMPVPDDDPDETYELTTDNAKKIMAIYMRFRCDIPVIVMGETGCGKTRLVKFMCDLMLPKTDGSPIENMIITKVHGGTTDNDIKRKVKEAESIAKQNNKIYSEKKNGKKEKQIYTVLFFDEANTTESIGLIKEILCDKSLDGEPLNLCDNLKFVAACNPYRRHTQKLIEKLENAGLGYHVAADETTDCLGRIAMRRLVYRVQKLPLSLLPFVWDFGQLSEYDEMLYIKQMVRRYARQGTIPNDEQMLDVISTILAQSQEYMRKAEDECSFVSLRDVERVLQVLSWFRNLYSRELVLFSLMDEKLANLYGNSEFQQAFKLEEVTRCFVLALGVCYHASLTNRKDYREHIAQYFQEPCKLHEIGPTQILNEIECCQEVILDCVTSLEENIARNQALKENVFMMVVCIELRIPLFLVGKPGSSKSLAKVVVTDAMQGNASLHKLFKELKQVQMVSFQCSPLSTPPGIVSTFKQCAMFQRGKSLDKFVSVAVLDEIGLAEDSPAMPLKTLHPLLEEGCEDNDIPKIDRKVAFIGISNWALDPAKMNRGIFVQRDVPDSKELENTAKGICSAAMRIPQLFEQIIKPLAKAYLEVFDLALKSKAKREFFGLRDFYSLMKMVSRHVDKSGKLPSRSRMEFIIQRNFSGLEFESETTDPVSTFIDQIVWSKYTSQAKQHRGEPVCTLPALIEACLTDTMNGSRHMLLLTENYNALETFRQKMVKTSIKITVVFGSSFRRDQDYTQVCRNISRIKLCMEAGYTVILLNSEKLYESLYDALNQYYVYFGGQRFVDLGLGSHRVKCPVHKKFKLIIVAEKQYVYDKFPIPLINRLEKYILTSNTMLTFDQNEVAEELRKWAEMFVRDALSQRGNVTEKDIGNVIVGYHEDACSAIVLHVSESQDWNGDEEEEETKRLEIMQDAKEMLISCATPDAIVRLSTTLFKDRQNVEDIYWKKQTHDSILDYLECQLATHECLFSQITTHGKLLVNSHRVILSNTTGIEEERILLLESLTAFDTEQQFNNKIRTHLENAKGDKALLVVQCDSGDKNANLIACARYSVLDEYEKYKRHLNKEKTSEQGQGNTQVNVHVLFIIQMPTMTSGNFKSIQCGDWHSVHIDTLHSASITMPSVLEMQGKTVAAVMTDSVNMIFGEKDKADEKKTERQNKTKKRTAIDFKEIFSMCVHGAMTRVRDTGEAGQRTSQRIALLLELLHKDKSYDPLSFLHGLTKQLVRLLNEKEKTAYFPVSANWLAKKAAAPDSIHKAGTLRRACQQTLGEIISPVLSGIVAFLDTNQNLNILKNDETSWQYLLWLAVLNGEGTITLSCRDIFPEGGREGLRDFDVLSTGANGRTFQSFMPFSWLIRKTIDDILRCRPRLYDKYEDGNQSDDIDVFERTSIGTAFQKVCGSQMDVVIESYIHDFVHMVYDCASKEEHKVVCNYLKAKTTERFSERKENLLDVHLAYSGISDSLKYFRNINHVWPSCSKMLLAPDSAENVDETSAIPDTNELTIKALYLMIKTISTATDQEECDLSVPEIKEKWLLDFHRYRNVVQQTLAYYLTEILTRGRENDTLLKIRSMWNRVVVLQLFLEDVCTTTGEKAITIDFSKALWASLTEEDDMKGIETLDSLEEFLSLCYNTAQSQYTSNADKCSNCESALHHQSTILPCGHTICLQCVQELRSKSKQNQKCFTCKAQLLEGWEDSNEFKNTEAYDRLQDYRRRCNIFFMDVVSQLCFSENQAPSDEVVDKLMSYSLLQQSSLDTSSVQTGVDPDEAFKAFILKHLIRTKEEKLKDQLSKYLSTEDASNLPGEQRSNLLLLIICCIEDNLVESAHGDIYLAIQSLKNAVELLEGEKPLVDKLYGVANARTGLAIVAKFIFLYVRNKGFPTGPDGENVRNIVRRASHLCRSFLPWKYLMKCIFRLGGSDILLTVLKSENEDVRWIRRDGEMQDQTLGGADMYLCCGEAYVQMRQNVTDVLSGDDNVKQFGDKIQEQSGLSSNYVAVMLELALHREITLSETTKQTRPNEQILRRVAECDFIKNKEFTMKLVTNGSEALFFHCGEDQELHVTVKCLLFHWYCVFSNVNSTLLPSILKPLAELAVEPNRLQGTYFPTMPQDELSELRDVLKVKTDEYKHYENPSVYVCPNGHPYEVRDCGKPYYMGKCLCGAEIGGTRHILHEGNRADTGEDRTLPGHVLGEASERKEILPERSLTSIYLATVRLILHLSMFGGCFTNKKSIAGFIKPEVEGEHVPAFLFAHILRDLEDMKTVLSSNIDDVLILLHFFVDKVQKMSDSERRECDVDIERLQKEKVISSSDISWNSKEGRKNWETCFATILLKPIIEDSQTILEHMYEQLQGTNSLLRLLGETAEKQSAEASLDNLAEDSKFWKYIAPISINSLKQVYERQLSSTPSDTKSFLHAFLEDVSLLQAVRFIPSVLRLHRALFRCYKYRLYRADAAKIRIRQLREDLIADDETNQLLDDTIEAWAIVKQELKGHVLNIDNVRMVVPGETQDTEINDDSPISVLLPTVDGKGICTYAMLDILLRRQNDLLDKYARMYGRDSDVKLPSVLPQHVTSAHLVSFNPQYDIQPLILANCTLHIGDASVEYNFAGFERQLVDRFVSTKTKVSVEPYLKIEQMIYRTDMKDADSLNKLENVVPQVGLDGRKSSQICSDLNTIPDLCQILAELDIIISFLIITSGDRTCPIHKYMSETLKMETVLLPQKIKINCQLQHMKSLWMALSLKKSFLMVQDGQTSETVFEIVPSHFHKRVPDNKLGEYESYLERFKDVELNDLLNMLFSYIILELTKKVDEDDDAPDITQYPLGVCLDAISGSKDGCGMPDGILTEHSANAWILVVKLISKRTEDKKIRGIN